MADATDQSRKRHRVCPTRLSFHKLTLCLVTKTLQALNSKKAPSETLSDEILAYDNSSIVCSGTLKTGEQTSI